MDISDEHRKLITNEIDYVRKKMAEAKSAEKKAYYYSAIYGMLDRVMRLEYDRQLLFIHFVMNSTYSVIYGQIQGIKSGTIPIELELDFFGKLDKGLASLQSHLDERKDVDIYGDLEYIVSLTWTITGGGFYDKEKFNLP